MYTFNEIQELISDRLGNIDFIKEPKNLYLPVQYTVESGGKRIRPSMVLMSYNLFKESVEEAIMPALAIEIFHNFTLLHDDIMDNSGLRRGKPTVHKKWDTNIAILSGDAMSIKAYEFLSRYTGKNFHEMFGLFNETALQICEGQQFDMDFEEREIVSEKEYIQMITHKTAVLLAASLKMGALAAEANPGDSEKLYEFGKYLGLSFQLQDDYLDLFGDPEVFGKYIGGDIVAGKKTYLLIKAYELASEKDKRKILELLHNEASREAKVMQAKELFEKYQISQLTSDKIQDYFHKAKESFHKVQIDEKRKQPLFELAEMLMNRNK